MSSFQCDKCGANIIDTDCGYVTGCEHYPLGEKLDIFPGDLIEGLCSGRYVGYMQKIVDGEVLAVPVTWNDIYKNPEQSGGEK